MSLICLVGQKDDNDRDQSCNESTSKGSDGQCGQENNDSGEACEGYPEKDSPDHDVFLSDLSWFGAFGVILDLVAGLTLQKSRASHFGKRVIRGTKEFNGRQDHHKRRPVDTDDIGFCVEIIVSVFVWKAHFQIDL